MLSNKLFAIGLILEAVDRFSRPATRISDAISRVERNSEGLRRELERSSRSLSRFVRGWEVVGKTLKRVSERFEAVKEKAERLKDVGSSLMIKGTAAFSFALSPTVPAAEFEKAMAEVSTLVDMSFEEFKKRYQRRILRLAVELGQSPVEVTRALYQAISAGIDPEKAFSFIREAGRAAVAGVSDIFTAVDLGTALKNAFKVDAAEMNKVWDVVFQAVRKGKTTFREIAGSMEQILAPASSAGIKLKEVMATMAQMTLTAGTPTAQAFTSLKYALEALSAPSEKAKKVFQQLGIEINAEVLREKGLIGTMQMLREALMGLSEAERAEALSDIFGSMEAQIFAKDFLVNADKYLQMLKTMDSAHGTTGKAFKKMASTASFAFDQLKVQLQRFAIVLGSTLLPGINAVLKALNTFLSPIAQFASKHQTLTKILIGGLVAFSLTTAAFGALGFVVGSLINAYTNLKIATELLTLHKARLLVAIRGVTGAFFSFNTALLANPITWVVAGIVALGVVLFWLQKRFGLLTKAWNWLSEGLVWLKNKILAFGTWLKTNWQAILKVFLYTNPITAPIMALNKLVKFVSGISLFEAGRKILLSLVEGLKSVALKPVEAVKAVMEKIRGLLPFSPAKWGPLADLHLTGRRFMETITAGIEPGTLVSKVSSILSTVRNLFLSFLSPGLHAITAPIRWISEKLPIPSLPDITGRIKWVSEAINQPALKPITIPEKIVSGKTYTTPGYGIPPITFNLTQHITVNGGHAEEVKEALKTSARDFEDAVYRALNRVLERQRRLSFSGEA